MRRILLLGLVVSLVAVFMLPVAAVAKDKGKSVCEKGGWMELVDADGEPFANQGECVKFATQGGTPMPPMTVLAVAWSEVDQVPGFTAGDVLIAQFEDWDGDGEPSAGDVVRVDHYPLDPDASGFGDFGIKEHVIETLDYLNFGPGVLQVSFVPVGATAHFDRFGFHWRGVEHGDAQNESYLEELTDAGQTLVADSHSGGRDGVTTTQGSTSNFSQSEPLTPVYVLGPPNNFSDDDHINVAIVPPPPVPGPDLLALAYVNVDGQPGYSPPTDQLIAQFEDVDGDGAPSAGDIIRTDQYPKLLGTSDLGQFELTTHVIPAVFTASHTADELSVSFNDGNGGAQIVWNRQATVESYTESGAGDGSWFIDRFDTAGFEDANAERQSPSLPLEYATDFASVADPADNDWINVVITPPAP